MTDEVSYVCSCALGESAPFPRRHNRDQIFTSRLLKIISLNFGAHLLTCFYKLLIWKKLYSCVVTDVVDLHVNVLNLA